MITIPKNVLFKLMLSHSKLAQAEFNRDPSFNSSHPAYVAEAHLLAVLTPQQTQEYVTYTTTEQQ